MDKCPVTRNQDSVHEAISSHGMQSPDAISCGLELEVKQKRLLAFFPSWCCWDAQSFGPTFVLEAFAVVAVIERPL